MVVIFGALVAPASAQIVRRPPGADVAPLDPPYRGLRHPRVLRSNISLPRRSDVLRLIAAQSPVKSQSARGTCSVFSATALLESMLIVKYGAPRSVDLSEEWLQYIVNRASINEGSTSARNFAALASFGTVDEQLLPYIGQSWKIGDTGLAQQRCGALSGREQVVCLNVHRDPRLLGASDDTLASVDPEFMAIRRAAAAFKAKYLAQVGTGNVYVGSNVQAKTLLARGVPLVLDSDFYYGAWNHRGGAAVGVDRDAEAWARGLIGYPAPGSVDRKNSPDKPSGHSILVVGYDDDYEVVTKQKMLDGSERTFRYTGVYFIKNSWGTDGFGVRTQIANQIMPGYGVITQQYAHEFGAFYMLGVQ